MKNMQKLALLSLLFLTAFCHSSAQGNEKKAPPVRVLLRGVFEFGGDEVAKIYFTNGEKQSVKAGQGVALAVGGELRVPGIKKLLLHATVGYKYVTTQADNVHIRMTRVPLQATANWMVTDKLRLGAGMVSHRAIRFKADGIGQDISFAAANGPTFEAAYRGIGLSYTAMTYKDQDNYTYSANAIGLSFTIALQKDK